SPPAVYSLSLHDALPISCQRHAGPAGIEVPSDLEKRHARFSRHRRGERLAERVEAIPRSTDGHGCDYGPVRGADSEEDNARVGRSEEHTSELQSRSDLVC